MDHKRRKADVFTIIACTDRNRGRQGILGIHEKGTWVSRKKENKMASGLPAPASLYSKTAGYRRKPASGRDGFYRSDEDPDRPGLV